MTKDDLKNDPKYSLFSELIGDIVDDRITAHEAARNKKTTTKKEVETDAPAEKSFFSAIFGD